VLEKLAKTRLKDVGQFQSALKELRPQLEYDALFADFLRGRPVVLAIISAATRTLLKAARFRACASPGTFGNRKIRFGIWKGYGANLPEFQVNALNAGHFNTQTDNDGVSRASPMLVEYKGSYYERFPSRGAPVPGLERGRAQRLQNGGAAQDRSRHCTRALRQQNYTGLEWLEVGRSGSLWTMNHRAGSLSRPQRRLSLHFAWRMSGRTRCRLKA